MTGHACTTKRNLCIYLIYAYTDIGKRLRGGSVLLSIDAVDLSGKRMQYKEEMTLQRVSCPVHTPETDGGKLHHEVPTQLLSLSKQEEKEKLVHTVFLLRCAQVTLEVFKIDTIHGRYTLSSHGFCNPGRLTEIDR